MHATATIGPPATRPRTGWDLGEWLRWQETLNPRHIDLGLERGARVADALGLAAGLPMPVITVAGTNGKGSCVAYLTRILEHAGYAVAAYTSPHVRCYNESLRLDGRPVGDRVLIEAFERVEAARGDIPLTFFEFRTLAALLLIRDARVDVAVLEVGLGGRLDAVNLVSPDVAVVTSIDLDHVDWLGPDRESIGREKAGIFRPSRPAVCGDSSPPASLVARAQAVGAELRIAGRDFSWERSAGGWRWRGPECDLDDLPAPSLGGDFQLANAATALMALYLLRDTVPADPSAVRAGVADAWLPGRQQFIPGEVERVIDVAHNGEAARALAETLAARPPRGRTHGVIAILADKDPAAIAGPLAGLVDAWHTATLAGPRGQTGDALARAIRALSPDRTVAAHRDVDQAWRAALREARPGDRVVAFGSFLTAGQVLEAEDG